MAAAGGPIALTSAFKQITTLPSGGGTLMLAAADVAVTGAMQGPANVSARLKVRPFDQSGIIIHNATSQNFSDNEIFINLQKLTDDVLAVDNQGRVLVIKLILSRVSVQFYSFQAEFAKYSFFVLEIF